MRPIAFAIPLAVLSLVTACSTSSQPVDRTTAVPSPTTSETSSSPSETSSSPSASSSSPTGSAPAGGAAVKLTGELGENNAFTITLVDDKGAPVTSIKAGTYEIKIKDTSAIHNFHLSGPGGIDVKTTVPEIKETTWPVTFVAGTYTYICDPHPSNMKKTFTVT
jgi:plastocyanin